MLDRYARGHDTRVVDDDERVTDHVREVCERPVIHPLGHAIVDQQARLVAARQGMLRNELRREVVFELPRFHPVPTVALPDMDDGALQRARARLDERAEAAALESLVVRAREQVEALTTATAALAETLPSEVGEAVREQARPMGRNLAEIRGLMNQVIRRLERVEADLTSERHARVDDLALLVDLVSAGWQNVDGRLATLESLVGRLEQLEESRGAVVYHMDGRRTDAATP
jgi:hypothetical protein